MMPAPETENDRPWKTIEEEKMEEYTWGADRIGVLVCFVHKKLGDRLLSFLMSISRIRRKCGC